MKIYQGKRQGESTSVTVDGAPLEPHSDLRDFHADGFEWGYEGSGPSQLGFALLVDHMGGEGAFQQYRKFVPDDIANRLREEIVEVPMDLETFFKKVRGEI